MSDAEKILLETMVKSNAHEVTADTAKMVGTAMGVCALVSHKMGLSRRLWMRTCRRLWREACKYA